MHLTDMNLQTEKNKQNKQPKNQKKSLPPPQNAPPGPPKLKLPLVSNRDVKFRI